MGLSTLRASREPLAEINTTPLIDVLLVLLIMLVITIPVATHSLELNLPGERGALDPDPVRNLLVVERGGELTWNGSRVSEAQLAGLLSQVRGMKPEPQVQFRPDPDASYQSSARVLQLVKASRITNFGFLDTQRHRSFSREP